MENFLKNYPFRCVLSLKPLIDYINNITDNSTGSMPCHITELQEKLEQAPELLQPIEDLSTLEPHSALVNELMSLIFAPLSWDTEAVAAVIPFTIKPFFVSPHFQRLFLNEDGSFRGRRNVDEKRFNAGRVIRAYLFILEKFYGIHQNFEYPLVHIVPDPVTGLDSYFKITFDFRFVETHAIGKPKSLTDKELTLIQENLTDPKVLREILPPEHFELHGFTVFKAVDVTESEIISALERDLINQESIVSQEGFLHLQERLRTLFRRPKLIAGLDAIHGDNILQLSSGCEMKNCCIFADTRHIPISTFEGTFYEKAIVNKEILLVPDILEECSPEQPKEESLKMGIRSMLMAPLEYKDENIGILHIGSPEPRDLGVMDTMLMTHIQPLFSMIVKKALDDLDTRVQGIIKEKCTAVHPTVEWRFQEAAFHHLENLRMGKASEIESIVFRDVYPLYGVSDIRGSTNERNRAVQEDLSEHLNLALNAISIANKTKPMLILEELIERIQSYLSKIEDKIGTGDELSVVKFLKEEVESVFPHLKSFGLKVSRAVDTYESAIDPNMGTVYGLRKDFEESVSILNDTLTHYIDEEESKLQSIFPHYFERHRTDGIDYLIYTGASLMENGGFDELYLKNFRLWQIQMACGMAWHTEQLKSSLRVPLDTAHLILVQDTALSIRFRFDEKRFDVDGSYDIRQEIIKSRLDKAEVKGRRERLTQPGKIAIVYSQPQEAKEIRHHINFLCSHGYLTGEIEEMELEELPGVRGLRCLRVGVDLESKVLMETVKNRAG